MPCANRPLVVGAGAARDCSVSFGKLASDAAAAAFCSRSVEDFAMSMSFAGFDWTPPDGAAMGGPQGEWDRRAAG